MLWSHHLAQKVTVSFAVKNLKPLMVLLAVLILPNPARAEFATPGQFDVTPSGGAQYTVPIAVPPGTAGMVPRLALTYNSQSGNGLLGVGWSLSGLSAVTRCPKSKIQDATIGPVGIQYAATDRYCLDGQRLVATSGTYGTNGTTYRTERDGFSKIISYGSNSYGPTSFKVWTKSGLTLEYGNTLDSAIEAQGKTAIRAWAVNKISDIKGNYLTITYTEDSTNGQYYPKQIDYTGNTSMVVPTYNSVRFVYDLTRLDTTPLYDGGSLFKTTARLTNVRTYAGTAIVKDYRLKYDPSAATQRSRLISLTECDDIAPAGTCLQPTTMGWQDGGATAAPTVTSWLSSTTTPSQNWNTASYQYVADFNGDGKTDYMWNYSDGWYVALSNGTGFDAPTTTWLSNTALPAGRTYNPGWQYIGDFDGDGKADYMWNWGGPWYVALSNGAGFDTATEWLSSSGGAANVQPWNTTGNQYVADFNGDGQTDYMWYYGDGWYVALSNGNGFNMPQAWLSPNTTFTQVYNGGYQYIADFNGDGKADYMWNYSNGWYVALSNGNGFDTPKMWLSNTAAPAGRTYNPGWQYIGDFNGDGKADYMWNWGGPWYVALSNGKDGFNTATQWLSSSGAPNGQTWNADTNYQYVADFNGDGKTDYMWNYSNGWYIALSTGTGFTYPSMWLSNTAAPAGRTYNPGWQYLGDFNGDGKTDYMWNWGGPWYVAQTAPSHDLLTTFTDGLNAATSVVYKPLTDATVYTKESIAVYPMQDIQTPLYVTASASSSNGIGGAFTNNYTYTGAKTHLWGGGFLGFHASTSTDAQTGLTKTTTYLQDYPHHGLTESVVQKTSAGFPVNQVANTWVFTTNAAWSSQYQVAQLTRTIESNYDLNSGVLFNQITSDNTYDACGNPTSIKATTLDAYVKTTTNTYTPNPINAVNCYLNRLSTTTVKSTAP